VATIVADKCVNPETKRPYTLSMIEKGLRDAHFSVNPSKGAKQQALKAVALLQRSLPIERAHMSVRVTVPSGEGGAIRSLLLDTMHARLDGESHPGGDAYAVDATLEPGYYKALEAEVSPGGDGRCAEEASRWQPCMRTSHLNANPPLRSAFHTPAGGGARLRARHGGGAVAVDGDRR
jgi:ribosome maturation protein SDO1